METIHYFIDLFLHLDVHLGEIITNYGTWTYAILFLIIFCETGLVVTPFLPGDSLLFAVGAFAAQGSLHFWNVFALILVAAILGDALNYTIGSLLGDKVFQYKDSKIFRKEYLEKTQAFFNKYGGKAIVIARFVPIVRTFAPFLAGVGKMKYLHFAMYNIAGALLWVVLLQGAGYMFSDLPIVKNNFSIVVLAIIFISLLPPIIEVIRTKKAPRNGANL